VKTLLKNRVIKPLALVLLGALLAVSCGGESPTIIPGEQVISPTSPTVGTEYMTVEGIYPDDAVYVGPFPIDTEIIIMFSKAVHTPDITTASVDIVPAIAGFTSVTPISGGKGVRIVVTGGFAFSTPYTVTVDPTLIRESGPGAAGIVGINDSSAFTTGVDSSADFYPQVIASSRFPADGAAGVSVDLSSVRVSFSKDVVNVTALTFAIAPNVALGPPAQDPGDSRTWILPLNTALINYNTLYTVTLDDVPPGIEDSDGNDLTISANNTWSFTTELDPDPGGPLTIQSVWFTNVTEDSITVNWTTNRPCGSSIVDYGTDTTYGTGTYNEPATPTYTVHSRTISPLANATKYYFRITVGADIQTSTTITAYNPVTPLAYDFPVTDKPLGNKTSLVTVQHHSNFSFNRASYAFWRDNGDNNVYGYYFDTANPPTNPSLWGADGASVDTNNRTNVRAFPDFMGRVIVTFEDGTNIYAKRVYNNAGALGFDGVWAAGAGNTGLNIGIGTNPGAVLVYGGQGNNNVDGGFVQKIIPAGAAPNLTEMPALINPLYDFSVNFNAGGLALVNGDHLYNRTTHGHATITLTSYRHVVDQSAALVPVGTNYIIANDAGAVSFAATDHDLFSAAPFVNGADDLYSPHNATAYGWGQWTLVNFGANWATVEVAPTTYNTAFTTDVPDNTNYLIDSGADFITDGIVVNDVVFSPPYYTNYALVTSVPADGIELGLGADLFTNGNEAYEVHRLITTGTANGPVAFQLEDIGATFTTAGIGVGDIVVDATDGESTTVTGILDDEHLTLVDDIFAGGETYGIVDDAVLASGNGIWTNLLVDVGSAWGAGMNGYLVENFTAGTTSTVSSVISNRIIQLGADIFANWTDTYRIYSDWCTTHPPPGEYNPFYYYDLDWNIGIVDTNVITMYQDRVNGTADAGRTNPLYDDGVNLGAAAIDDIVVDVSGWQYARVNDEAYDTAGALGLTSNIMADGENYWILRFLAPAVATEPLAYIGRTTAGTAGTTMVSTTKSANFATPTVVVGDLVYNITQDRYAVVTAVTDANTLSLNRGIFAVGDYFIIVASNEPLIETGVVSAFAGNSFDSAAGSVSFTASGVQPGDIVHNNTTNADAVVVTVNDADTLTLNAPIMGVGDRYVIISGRVLFAYERGGDIYGKIIRLRDGSTYGAEITICNSAGVQDTVYVMDRGFRNNDNGGAYVVYRNVDTNTWYAKRVNGNGTVVDGGLGVAVTPAGVEMKQVLSNNNGAFYLLYKSAPGTASLYLRRITNALAVQWTTAAIPNVIDAAMCVSTNDTRVNIAYSRFVVANNRDNEIYVQRFDYDGDNDNGFGETALLTLAPYGYAGGLSITPDGFTGAIVSWYDERYYASLGYVLMAQAVDIAGTRLWDADAGGGTDFDGVMIAIPNAWEAADIYNKSLFYNDGGSPYGGLFLWYDYRNSRTDIFYDVRSN